MTRRIQLMVPISDLRLKEHVMTNNDSHTGIIIQIKSMIMNVLVMISPMAALARSNMIGAF